MTKNRRNKRKARGLAASTGSNYTSARRQVTGGWTLYRAVAADVEAILDKQLPGMSLESVGDLVLLNEHLDLSEATVQSLVADFDTLVVQTAEEFEGGTQAIHATVEAELVWEGLLMKMQAHALVQSGGAEFIDADFNDHYSLVQIVEDEPVTATLTGIADPHAESIESLNFDGVALAIS
jgi:hypothetical protein